MGTPSELARRMAPRLEVSIEIDPSEEPKATALLRSMDGLSVSVERAGIIRVGGLPRERVPSLASRLVEAGVSLYRLEPHEPSLTDAYFALQESRQERP